MSIRIFVEGDDDKKFIISILNDLKKNAEISVSDNINFLNYIVGMRSKSKLLNSTNKQYERISGKIGFEIEKVLFIFDSDFEKDDKNCNGIKNSRKCFEELKNQLNWEIDIDYYIFNRNLDYFLVETIKDKECYEYFDNLVKCLEIEKLKPNKKPIANLYKDLYPHPHFEFKDDRFQALKDKLIDLFKGIQQ